MVQLEIEKRERTGNHSSSIFAGRILCAECGSIYGSKVWHSTDKYRKVIWQCNNKYTGDTCGTPSLNEIDIKRWFSQALGKFLEDRDAIIANLRRVQQVCVDPMDTEKQMENTRQEMEVTENALRQCIADNAAASITEEEYRQRYDHLYEKFQGLEKKKAALDDKLMDLRAENSSIEEVITLLETTGEIPIEFDPAIWRIVVEKVLVGKDNIRFIMIGGKEYSFRIY